MIWSNLNSDMGTTTLENNLLNMCIHSCILSRLVYEDSCVNIFKATFFTIPKNANNPNDGLKQWYTHTTEIHTSVQN